MDVDVSRVQDFAEVITNGDGAYSSVVELRLLTKVTWGE
jgi:hypothetical protein